MQKLPLRKFFVSLLCLLAGHKALAQYDSLSVKKDTIDYYEMTLDQLISLKAHGVPSELEELINSLISVASKKPLSTRESPGIVSLITEEEIRKSGARDLIDVLRLVPGFDFGVDVEGVVGLGLRGNWGHEGKVLVLLDGQETNEILFATTQLGNHYPVEQIKKVEIIRGPGSAIYGGFAEYGVINIVTKQGGDLNGVNASATYGQYAKDFARKNLNLSVGQKVKDLEYSISGLLGYANRSDRTYTDLDGASYSMAGSSALNPKYLNGAISYKNLSLRCIADLYETSMRDGYTTVVSGGPVVSTFNSFYSELKYLLKVNDKLTVTPRINFKSQSPWNSEIYNGKEAYDKTADRISGNLSASYDLSRNIHVLAGSEYYYDKAMDHTDSSFFSNGKQTVSYYNYAFFAQGLVKTRFVNLILGARYDKHNAYGDAFVPRVGLTKKYDKFHFKALYSGSFRAPSIENINYSPGGIRPELTNVVELELGYQITRKSILTVNLFDITTNDPIVFYTDSLNNDLYTNFGSAGTRGIEAEYRIRSSWGYLTLNYAYYTAADKEKVEEYKVEEDRSALAAFANHKASLNASINLLKRFSLSPSLAFYGPRWGYTTVDNAGDPLMTRFDPMVLANLFMWYKAPVKGLNIGLGVYNLLNADYDFIQPYNGYHAPLPGPSREFIIRVQYDLTFKSKDKK